MVEKDDSGICIGYTVPEADREIQKTPLSQFKNNSVAALALEGESYEVIMVDLKHSKP